jgi:hypothetical protein
MMSEIVANLVIQIKKSPLESYGLCIEMQDTNVHNPPIEWWADKEKVKDAFLDILHYAYDRYGGKVVREI